MCKIFSCEHVKTLLLAILIVILIRFFCLEPYKIPTSSMEPTLIGDPQCGDNILVNKFQYFFEEPQRWEVVVFKYPLDQRRNFIKRLIGLPGEEVAIHNGNIYINGKIARKPAHVQEALAYPLFVHQDQEDHYRRYWETAESSWKWQDHGIAFQAETDPVWLTYQSDITNEYQPIKDRLFYHRSRSARRTGGGATVGEVVLACRLTLLTATGSVLVQLRQGSDRFRLTLHSRPNTPGSLCWYEGEELSLKKRLAITTTLSAGKVCRLHMSNLDAHVVVQCDGTTLASLDWDRPLDESPHTTYESSVRIGGVHGSFHVSHLSLSRDIYYLGRGDIMGGSSTWKIPSQHYFVLGDNSPDSSDSREWKIFQILLDNGLVLEGDQQIYSGCDDGYYRFQDTYGLTRTIPETQTHNLTTHQESPFVSRDHFIGKALSVFWPPVRIKWIR